MNNPEICRRLLEILLDIKIKHISFPEKQKTIEILSDGKGVRLDVYVDDENEMPGPICVSENELINSIILDEFDMDKVRAFRDKFFKYQDGKSCERVVKLIDRIMEGEVE